MAGIHVLVVSEKGVGFTVNAITEALQKHDLKIWSVAVSDKKVIDYISQAMIVLIVDIKVEDNSLNLYKIEHVCEEKKKQVYLYGNQDEISDLRTVFKGRERYTEFVRPVEYEEIAKQAANLIKVLGTESSRKKILVVDDNGVFLRTVMGWLEGSYEVSLANSAASAFRAINKSRPDLILLDYEMPVCSGAQFMEMLTVESDFADIPVIFLTSRCDPETVKEVMKLRPVGYVLKSTPQAELLKTIENYFIRAEAN